MTRRAARLFTDGRYTAQAAEEVKAAQVQIVSGSPAVAAVQWLAAQAGRDRWRDLIRRGPRWRSWRDGRRSCPAACGADFFQAVPAPFVEILRCVKDEDELALMAEAALLGCRLFEHILSLLRPGIAEIEVAAELEHQARMLGAEGMSFETIVASGVRSAMPHGRATRRAAAAAGVCDARLRYNPQGLLFGYDAHRFSGQAKAQGAGRIRGGAGGPGGRGRTPWPRA